MEMENGELENHRQLMKSVVEQVGLLRQATQASLILLKGPIFQRVCFLHFSRNFTQHTATSSKVYQRPRTRKSRAPAPAPSPARAAASSIARARAGPPSRGRLRKTWQPQSSARSKMKISLFPWPSLFSSYARSAWFRSSPRLAIWYRSCPSDLLRQLLKVDMFSVFQRHSRS